MCCKLLAVRAMEKPVDVWCRHCAQNKGCGIYETRPQVCRAFLCGYLTDATLNEDWKPVRSKFVIVPVYEKNCVMIHVDPDFPDAWRREPYHSALWKLARKGAQYRGRVLVRTGYKTIVLTP